MTDRPLWNAHVDEQDGAFLVALVGEVDLAGADELQRILVEQLDRPGAVTVVADLSRVTFLDSAALGALIQAFQHAREHRRRFVIARPAYGVKRIMEISGVYDILSGAGEQ